MEHLSEWKGPRQGPWGSSARRGAGPRSRRKRQRGPGQGQREGRRPEAGPASGCRLQLAFTEHGLCAGPELYLSRWLQPVGEVLSNLHSTEEETEAQGGGAAPEPWSVTAAHPAPSPSSLPLAETGCLLLGERERLSLCRD